MVLITAGWFLWFLFMIPPLIFMIYAQAKVNSAFKKYSRVANMHGVTGAQAAEILLRDNGLSNVKAVAQRMYFILLAVGLG
jgi:Zn-dependent membrane protease YugP